MELEFTLWWKRVIARLYEGGIDELPDAKQVDHEAFEAGMVPDEWAWVYYTAGLDEADMAGGDAAPEPDRDRWARGL
jgi:hypothetical protein